MSLGQFSCMSTLYSSWEMWVEWLHLCSKKQPLHITIHYENGGGCGGITCWSWYSWYVMCCYVKWINLFFFTIFSCLFPLRSNQLRSSPLRLMHWRKRWDTTLFSDQKQVQAFRTTALRKFINLLNSRAEISYNMFSTGYKFFFGWPL